MVAAFFFCGEKYGKIKPCTEPELMESAVLVISSKQTKMMPNGSLKAFCRWVSTKKKGMMKKAEKSLIVGYTCCPTCLPRLICLPGFTRLCAPSMGTFM